MTEEVKVHKPIPKAVADLAFIGTDLILLAIIVQVMRFFPSLEPVANYALLGIPIGLVIQLIAYFKLAKEWEDNKTRAYVLAYALSIGSSFFMIAVLTVVIYLSLPEGTQKIGLLEFINSLADFGLEVIFVIFLTYVTIVGDGLMFYMLHKHLHEISGIKEFKTSGLLMRIGTILLIVGIGILLIIASLGLQILLWGKIKGQYEQDSF